MNDIFLLDNAVQNYGWGSYTAIPDLLGLPSPSKEPMAELWMGAHPKAPSKINQKGVWHPLDRLIDENPGAFLGENIAGIYGNALPYLFKVLAAAEPLSIQAHPNQCQAQKGFESENRAGIPLNAPHRNYRDSNHKPEIICALTPFYALNGFRRFQDIAERLGRVCPESLKSKLNELRHFSQSEALKDLFGYLMMASPDRKRGIVKEATTNARNAESDPEMCWIGILHEKYPGDIGVLGPLFLNLVRLEPGQAMFLPAGQLHAYLEGTGLELMANSDNVLRGGLTPKHIDVHELLRVLRFDETQIDILKPRYVSEAEQVYDSPAEEFCLSIITGYPDKPLTVSGSGSADILLCTDGKGRIAVSGGHTEQTIKKGDAYFVPASVGAYRIQGQAIIYRASVPN